MSTSGRSSHLYWVSCNRCGTRFHTAAQQKMFLVSCGCMFCSRCVQGSTQGNCAACGRSSAKVLPIGSSLPQTVREMFNRNEESMAKINKRLEFRQTHFKRC